MRGIIIFLVVFLVFSLLFRFAGFMLVFLIRYWYITLLLAGYLIYKSRKTVKTINPEKKSKLDPDKEVKLDKDPTIEDE